MLIKEIADLLREEWRAHHKGGCRILSLGDGCKCHLCLIDKLAAKCNEKEE